MGKKKSSNHPYSVWRMGAALLGFPAGHPLGAQDNGQLHGNFSMDAQYYEDDVIGAVVPLERLAANSWMNLIYSRTGSRSAGDSRLMSRALQAILQGSRTSIKDRIRYAKYPRAI